MLKQNQDISVSCVVDVRQCGVNGDEQVLILEERREKEVREESERERERGGKER